MTLGGGFVGALAAVEVAAVVFVMNKDGTFHRRHLLAEARRHLALVLRGRRRESGLDEQVVHAAIATHCLGITEPKTLRSRTPAHRLYTTQWTGADLRPARRRPTIPTGDHRLPPDTGTPATPRPLDQASGEWEIPRVPLRYDRAVLAAGVVRAKLRTTLTATGDGRGPGYDVVAHQQGAMPERERAGQAFAVVGNETQKRTRALPAQNRARPRNRTAYRRRHPARTSSGRTDLSNPTLTGGGEPAAERIA